MAKKLVALFVMCVIVVTAMQAREAEAANTVTFDNCVVQCQYECKAAGDGYPQCTFTCKTICSAEKTQLRVRLMNEFQLKKYSLS
ncbi:hypothetical protein TIFTF001_026614 [Ficus carica]|uniref:Uncharacterized protein n=1 Tax=Ficus carica TaxID=3494 RepID=A0AA88DLT1_FICCA|nr:hypothetical protein TIFTF001_026614 [Ficus carica]